MKARHKLISNYLSAGQRVVRAESASHPGDGFEPTTPTLEDMYFTALCNRRGTARADTRAAA